MATIYILAIFSIVLGTIFIGRSTALQSLHVSGQRLHSRPIYHGVSLALYSVLPPLILSLVWAMVSDRFIETLIIRNVTQQFLAFDHSQIIALIREAKSASLKAITTNGDSDVEQVANLFYHYRSISRWLLLAGSILLGGVGFTLGYRSIKASYRARDFVEKSVTSLLALCSVIAILVTLGIVFSLLFETIAFFGKVSVFDFLFGMHWSPQSAFEGAGSESGAQDNSLVFGAVPLFAGTFLITAIAMLIAAPVGLMAAIYLSDYSSSGFRAFAKPVMEILAGIPTVVYGFFAALTIAPAIRGWGEYVGLDVSSESALAAGLVMGIMIIPFVSSLSDDVINAVPQSLRDGSYALGATKSETIRRVILPAALPGIVSALLLAVSRAVGETMIVVMAAGLAANLTLNPLEAVTTVTVQIVTLLVGDQEFDSAKTLAAFALGLVLFVITLALNIIALRVVNKYREQYD